MRVLVLDNYDSFAYNLVQYLGELGAQVDTVRNDRATVDELVTRVMQTSGFNYWESGMDMRLGEDLYDSFVEYQKRLLTVFDRMSDEYGFHVVDSSASIQSVSDQIKELLEPMLVPA